MPQEYRYLFRSDLVKMYHNLTRKLRKRIDNIRSYGAKNASQIAVEKWDELIASGRMPKNIKSLSERELRQLIAQLKYIDSLKSSKVEGAKFVKTEWDEKVKKKFDFASPETEKKFWRLYSLAIEQPQIYQFRYETADLISDILVENPNADDLDILKAIDDAFLQASIKSKRKGGISGEKLENEFKSIRTRFSK